MVMAKNILKPKVMFKSKGRRIRGMQSNTLSGILNIQYNVNNKTPANHCLTIGTNCIVKKVKDKLFVLYLACIM